MNVRFGIIGAGHIGTRFGSVLRRVEGVELYAVADANAQAASRYAQALQVPHCGGDIEALLRDPAVDAVYIGVPNRYHFPIAKRALQSGKAVLCEKPMCLNAGQAQELTALAAECGQLLMEGMWTRCMPAFLRAKQWLREGRIGEARFLASSFSMLAPFDAGSRLYDRQMGGGSLYDVGVYCVHFALGLLDSAPVRVEGVARVGATGVDESDAFTLQFADGAIAAGSCGFLADTVPAGSICGSEGRIELDEFYRATACRCYTRDGRLAETFQEPCEDGFLYEIAHFRDLYREGRTQSDLIPLSTTLECARVCDELLKKWGIA